MLMEEVSKELKEVLASFKRDKSLAHNRWLIDFFIGYYKLSKRGFDKSNRRGKKNNEE
jgi:hypothetical protein